MSGRFEIKHGMYYSHRTEYKCWQAIKQRCLNKLDKRYKDYGGRGITICERWLNSFENFVEDMGRCPKGQSIERVNNNGSYEPTNCIWAFAKTQNNNKRSCVVIEYNGMSKNITQWAKYFGVHETTLHSRIKAKWPIDKVMQGKIINYAR